MPPEVSPLRSLMEEWALRNRLELPVTTELESYDLMGQLVAMGMGAALVPRRSVAQMLRRKQLEVISLPRALKREIVVVCGLGQSDLKMTRRFVDSILFGG